jgi:hypothetical protein
MQTLDTTSPTADQSITRAVWKFPVPFPGPDVFSIEMPASATMLTVQVQHGEPQIWALVIPSGAVEEKTFRIAGTGHLITEPIKGYVGTFQVASGSLVLHVFEVWR